MEYMYGNFTSEQIKKVSKSMHDDIHRLLLYKDKNVSDEIFKTDEDFIIYFSNLLYRFGGLNELLGEPPKMVNLMATLQAAYDSVINESFSYGSFRRAILDAHGYIKEMFETEADLCQV